MKHFFHRNLWKKTAACFALLLFILTPALRMDGAVSIPDASELFYAADFANVLSRETEDRIINYNDALYQATGAQIVVATVDFLDGAEIEDYAYRMFNQWQIGDKNKNNGVLLLLVIGEENYWIVQGKGLEKSLSSGTLDGLLQEYLEPDFARADYDAGVRKTFDALIGQMESIYGIRFDDSGASSTTTGSVGQETGSSKSSGLKFDNALLIALVLIFIFSYINRQTKKRQKREARRTSPLGGPVISDRTWRTGDKPPEAYDEDEEDNRKSGGSTGGLGGWFWPFLLGRLSSGIGRSTRSKGSSSSGSSRPRGFGGGFGGGGKTRGGGAGRRSSGGFGGFGGFGGSSRGGGFGGGGGTRGGGAGRH